MTLCLFRSLSAPQKMQDLLQNGTSRYKEEFVEIIRLGKGGFGSVFKVCNYFSKLLFVILVNYL